MRSTTIKIHCNGKDNLNSEGSNCRNDRPGPIFERTSVKFGWIVHKADMHIDNRTLLQGGHFCQVNKKNAHAAGHLTMYDTYISP